MEYGPEHPEYRLMCTFVGHFWNAARAGDTSGWAMLAQVEPHYLLNKALCSFYEIVQRRFVAGEGLDPAMIAVEIKEKGLPPETLRHVELATREKGVATGEITATIRNTWRRNTVVQWLHAAADHIASGKGGGADGRKSVDKLILRLGDLYHQDQHSGGYKTKEQIIASLLAEHESGKFSGSAYWLPKLEKHIGPALPGQVVAWCAFSNAGKTVWSSNGFRNFAVRGMPQICFPTESKSQFMDRVGAQWATELANKHGGPGVSASRAQRRQWKGHEEEYERFKAALHDFKQFPWTVVDNPSITPAQVQLAVRILRRQWPGQTVQVWVDHMHRLDYENEEADALAGEWTQRFKNMAVEDDSGLTFQLLYQPRKPGAGDETHRPVLPQEIRGHSSIWNECDIYVSPFRCHVLTDKTLDPNPWGTWRTMRDADMRPMMGKKSQVGDGDAKLSDEDMHIWIGKRRIDGEMQMPVEFRYDNFSGRIYETAMYGYGEEAWSG